MCISCGCGRFEENHGDERHITVATLNRAAAAGEMTVEDVMKNVAAGCQEMMETGAPDHQSNGQAMKERLRQA